MGTIIWPLVPSSSSGLGSDASKSCGQEKLAFLSLGLQRNGISCSSPSANFTAGDCLLLRSGSDAKSCRSGPSSRQRGVRTMNQSPAQLTMYVVLSLLSTECNKAWSWHNFLNSEKAAIEIFT
jgi:hypothetical protein